MEAMEWPMTGVQLVGPLDGRKEGIEKTFFFPAAATGDREALLSLSAQQGKKHSKTSESPPPHAIQLTTCKQLYALTKKLKAYTHVHFLFTPMKHSFRKSWRQ